MYGSKIVLISGPISSGKSSLASELAEHNFTVAKTSDFLKEEAESRDVDVSNRVAKQNLALSLDRETGGAWVARRVLNRFSEAVRQPMLGTADRSYAVLVVEGFRIPEQVRLVRQMASTPVLHVHVVADSEVLKQRYESRRLRQDINLTYEEAAGHPNEQKIDDLRNEADLVLDTGRTSIEDCKIRVLSRLGVYASPDIRCVDVIVGGQYGSEGKGHVAAYLSKEYDILVRVGGPNAGHKVKTAEHLYTYHQLPSGCRDHSTARVLIGPGAIVNPTNILKEISDCNLGPDRLVIDRNAMIISQDDIASEVKLVASISSTGQGVGAATARKILGRGEETTMLAEACPDLKPFVGDTQVELEQAYASGKKVLLEGTQGTGLSIHHGSYPHVTSRDTTVAGCLSEAGISPARVRRILLVVRTYPIRVANPSTGGTSGQLKREISFSDIAKRSGLDPKVLLETEKTSTTKRDRRVGEFEWDLFRLSCALNAPTDVVLTFADYLDAKNALAYRYEQLTVETQAFIEELERVAHAPVSLINTKFEYRSVIDRRNWH